MAASPADTPFKQQLLQLNQENAQEVLSAFLPRLDAHLKRLAEEGKTYFQFSLHPKYGVFGVYESPLHSLVYQKDRGQPIKWISLRYPLAIHEHLNKNGYHGIESSREPGFRVFLKKDIEAESAREELEPLLQYVKAAILEVAALGQSAFYLFPKGKIPSERKALFYHYFNKVMGSVDRSWEWKKPSLRSVFFKMIQEELGLDITVTDKHVLKIYWRNERWP